MPLLRLLLAMATVACRGLPVRGHASLDSTADCYALQRVGSANNTADSIDWLGFASGTVRLEPAPALTSDTNATGTARWLEWRFTPEMEQSLLIVQTRLDEIYGRPRIVAPRDSLLARALATYWAGTAPPEGRVPLWRRRGDDSLEVIERAGASTTTFRLALAAAGQVTGTAQLRKPSTPRTHLDDGSPRAVDLRVAGGRVPCPQASPEGRHRRARGLTDVAADRALGLWRLRRHSIGSPAAELGR